MFSFSKKTYLIASLLLALLLSACGQNVKLHRKAEKEYKQGLYEESLRSNTESLKLKRTHIKAQELLKKNFSGIVASRENRIESLKRSGSPDVWDKLVTEYTELISLQKLVEPFNPLYNPKTGMPYDFQLKDYSKDLATSKENAAEYHYSKAMAMIQKGTMPDTQKEAVKELVAAQSFVPNYKDSTARLGEARKLAVKRIAILTFDDKTGTDNRYGGIVDMLTESIIGKLVQDKEAGEFMKIVTRSQIEQVLAERQLSAPAETDAAYASNIGSMLGAHEIMTGKILQINYIAPQTIHQDLKETDKITTKQKVVDEKGKKKKQDITTEISCEYTKFTKTAEVQIIASFSLVEVSTGRVKLQDTVKAEFPWSDIWARFKSGDEKALTPATQALIKKTEPMPPSEIEMVNTALMSLSDSIVDKVRNYVK